MLRPALPSPPVRFGLGLTIGSALVMSCGGSPASTTGAGAANLPPQTNPGVVDKDKDKNKNNADGPKRNLKGTVVDSLTGEPIDKAMIFIEGVATTVESTPIPAAPSPTKDELDDGQDGDASPTDAENGPILVAQADDPVIPDAETTTSPRPGASPATGVSRPPGSSPLPGSSPSPGSSPLPGSSPSPGGANSPTPGASGSSKDGAKTPDPSGSSAPAAVGTPYPATAYKIDSRGRFELKDLPEGSYNLTFWAPGYQATTIQGGLPSELEVLLRPIDVDAKQLHEMKGVVRRADNQAAPDVDVEVSSVAGKLPGVHESTDANGNFGLKGLYAGNYAVAAVVSDEAPLSRSLRTKSSSRNPDGGGMAEA
jgi:hypothetical protein